jgi:hypothetical protein
VLNDLVQAEGPNSLKITKEGALRKSLLLIKEKHPQ